MPEPFELRVRVQPLKGPEEFMGVGHIEASAICPDKIDVFRIKFHRTARISTSDCFSVNFQAFRANGHHDIEQPCRHEPPCLVYRKVRVAFRLRVLKSQSKQSCHSERFTSSRCISLRVTRESLSKSSIIEPLMCGRAYTVEITAGPHRPHLRIVFKDGSAKTINRAKRAPRRSLRPSS